MARYINVLDKFKDVHIVNQELENIFLLTKKLTKEVKIMEVCGTHTMQISKFGIRKLLPDNIKLISGPGCPVCVTPVEYIDKAIYLLRNFDVIITTFGDMFRVPGSESSLEQEKSNGKDVRVIYSPEEVVNIAVSNPNKDVVFLSIGFETTMPAVAAVVKEVKQKSINNIYFLLGNKFFLPALEVLILQSRNYITSSVETTSSLDGFILPGHLSSIIGKNSYLWIAEKYKIAGVITGFEPVDILRGIRMLIEMIVSGKPEIKNEYTRVVTDDGNIYAKNIIKEVFEPTEGNWRGIGVVAYTGAKFKNSYQIYDAEVKFNLPKFKNIGELAGCRCNEVLTGKITPFECPLFAKLCTPAKPKGACMVSQEGTCAAYYKYER